MNAADVSAAGTEECMAHDIHAIVRTLREATRAWRQPIVTEIARLRRDPFCVLISTILSLRTKDEVTRAASERLFALADTPEGLLGLDLVTLERCIFPVGFYRNKAKTIHAVCHDLIEFHGGRVPADLDELLRLPGVGRKTANLVRTLGYGLPGICVDTHVHRIMNRLGYVRTRTPEETEFALRDKLPAEYWIEINDLLVTFGQNMCKPISPLCSRCPIHDQCQRVGVTTHR